MDVTLLLPLYSGMASLKRLKVVDLTTAKDNLGSKSKKSTHYFPVNILKMCIKVITHQTFPLGTLLFLRPKDCALASINISCHS